MLEGFGRASVSVFTQKQSKSFYSLQIIDKAIKHLCDGNVDFRFESLRSHSVPEILRVPLEELCLHIMVGCDRGCASSQKWLICQIIRLNSM